MKPWPSGAFRFPEPRQWLIALLCEIFLVSVAILLGQLPTLAVVGVAVAVPIVLTIIWAVNDGIAGSSRSRFEQRELELLLPPAPRSVWLRVFVAVSAVTFCAAFARVVFFSDEVFGGYILDHHGNRLKGATVLAREEGEKFPRFTTTDGSGHFSFRSLKHGRCDFDVFLRVGDHMHLMDFSRDIAAGDRPVQEDYKFAATPYRIAAFDQVFFDKGRSELDLDARHVVAGIRLHLLRDEARLLILGHADETGGATRNRELSQQRASGIAHSVTSGTLKSTSVVLAAFGSQRPANKGDSAKALAANRRTEILVLEVNEPVAK